MVLAGRRYLLKPLLANPVNFFTFDDDGHDDTKA